MKNKITRIEHYEDMVVIFRGTCNIREYVPCEKTVEFMKSVLMNLYELGLVKPSQSYITLAYRFDILEAPLFRNDLDELGCHSEGTLVKDLLADNSD